MERLEKKIQLGLAVTICVLSAIIAISQTAMMNVWHPAIIAFWLMPILSLFIVKRAKKELNDMDK